MQIKGLWWLIKLKLKEGPRGGMVDTSYLGHDAYAGSSPVGATKLLLTAVTIINFFYIKCN